MSTQSDHNRVIIVDRGDAMDNGGYYDDGGAYDQFEGDFDDEDDSEYNDAMYPQDFVGGDMPEEDPNAYKPEEEEHVNADALYGVQKRTIRYCLKGSLEQLNRQKLRTVRRLNERAHPHMKQVTSMRGRNNPTAENTAGNLDRIVLLGVRIVNHVNQYPVAIGYNINSKILVPGTLTDTGDVYTGVLEAKAPSTTSDRVIFEPTNIFSRRMLEQWERVDPEALDQEFIFPKVGNGTCLVRVDDGTGTSVAIELLRNHPHLFPGINANEIVRNRLERIPYSELPEDVGRQLHTHMAGEIEKIAASFISVNDLSMSFHCVDGNDWNTWQNLEGEAVALEPNKQSEYKKIALNSVHSAAVQVELTFIPVP